MHKAMSLSNNEPTNPLAPPLRVQELGQIGIVGANRSQARLNCAQSFRFAPLAFGLEAPSLTGASPEQ
jgi:hypothetical protein